MLDEARPFKNLSDIEIKAIQSLLTWEYYLHRENQGSYDRRFQEIKAAIQSFRESDQSTNSVVLDYRKEMDTILQLIETASSNNKSMTQGIIPHDLRSPHSLGKFFAPPGGAHHGVTNPLHQQNLPPQKDSSLNL